MAEVLSLWSLPSPEVSWVFSALLCQTPLCLFSTSFSSKLCKLPVSLNLDIFPKKVELPREVRRENENLFSTFQGLFLVRQVLKVCAKFMCVLLCFVFVHICITLMPYVEKVMATHSSMLARKIPWTEEPGRLQFLGSQKSQTQLSN